MHILHIIGTIDPAAGGPSESVRALLNFGPPGYTGEVLTLDQADSPFFGDLPCPAHGLGPQTLTYGYNSRLYKWLRANRERFDGVMVNGLWQYIGLAAWLALRGRKPYMVFSHGMLDPYFKREFPLKHLKKWGYWLAGEYWVLRGAYRVLFTTQEESRLAQQSFWLHRWQGYVISFGANRPPGDAERLREVFLTAYPEMRGRRSMLYLGRIHRKKGCDLLIRSFVRFASQDPELHLVMAGPDQQGWADGLKAIVAEAGLSDRVHWPGMLHGDVKWGAFCASEVFILPSHQENFGIAVAEALGCGRPVLLTDKVNIAREIADDGAGLMETDTQDGTDNLVRRWMELPAADRAAMGLQAHTTFGERYDMQVNAAKIMRLFEDAVPSRE